MKKCLAPRLRLLFCSSAVLLSCSAASAEDQPTLDELLNLSPPADASPDETPPSPTESTTPGPTDDVAERLTGQQIGEAFDRAVADMDRVADRLSENADPGLDTQRLQESILSRLDQLIEAAEQSSNSGGGGSGSSSNQDSSAQNAGQQPQPGNGQQPGQANASAGENPGGFSPGQVGPVDPGQGAIDEVRSEWGTLPPRLRDELTNGLDEPYSPVYRNLTEAYYRRLAEEAGE